jgi:class 3 adenylate cyclase
MTLRTTVLMKTDITGSTPRFRTLLVDDLQALLLEHRTLLARLAVAHGGRIFREEGDGHWLEFPSVTDAAKSAVAMHEALRLAQPAKGDNRISMRIVIGLGDVAPLGSDLVGEPLALITRIEDVTPADEIYLTLAARLALVPAEIQTSLVKGFAMPGFAEPIPVYRVETRHRTNVNADAYILIADLRGFGRLARTASMRTVERVLDRLETLTNDVAHQLEGTIRFSAGDSYFLTFPQASHLIAAAEQLSQSWKAASHEDQTSCGMHIVLHRGRINAFRSFLYGDGMEVGAHVLTASRQVLAGSEGGAFVTNIVRDELASTPWHNRLRLVELELPVEHTPGSKIFRLDGA